MTDSDVQVTPAVRDVLEKVATGQVSCQEEPMRAWLVTREDGFSRRLPRTTPAKLLEAGWIELGEAGGPLGTRTVTLTEAGRAARDAVP